MEDAEGGEGEEGDARPDRVEDHEGLCFSRLVMLVLCFVLWCVCGGMCVRFILFGKANCHFCACLIEGQNKPKRNVPSRPCGSRRSRRSAAARRGPSAASASGGGR